MDDRYKILKAMAKYCHPEVRATQELIWDPGGMDKADQGLRGNEDELDFIARTLIMDYVRTECMTEAPKCENPQIMELGRTELIEPKPPDPLPVSRLENPGSATNPADKRRRPKPGGESRQDARAMEGNEDVVRKLVKLAEQGILNLEAMGEVKNPAMIGDEKA